MEFLRTLPTQPGGAVPASRSRPHAMNVLGPIAFYLLIVAASAYAAMPLCRAVFGDVRRVPLITVSVTVGPPVALLLFSLVARLVPAYVAAAPITLIAILVAAWMARRRAVCTGGAGRRGVDWDLRADLTLLCAYAMLFLGLYALRAQWPSLYWDNDYAHVGTEKLFNFSLIQSYVYGSGYPPENLWLAGQPIDYYVLLHALPGLAAWAWRVLTGDGAAGGVLFVFSDVFLLLLGSFALSAWSQALLASGDSRLARRPALAVSLGLGVGVLLSTSGQAVRLVLSALGGGADVGWWLLEREAVPYTYSQYPFYLLLQGDHHAFQRVFFLQVALYGVVALLFQARRLECARIVLAAALASAVLLAHSGSVLLDVAILGTACVLVFVVRAQRRQWPQLRTFAANLGMTGALALALSLPGLWHSESPAIAWYWVETGLASPLSNFLSAQAGPLVFFVAALAAGMVAVRAGSDPPSWQARRGSAALAAAVVLACLAVQRGGAAVALACAFGTLALAPRRSAEGEDRTALVLLGSAAFVAWLMPEFLVGDFAHRGAGEWKRWNLAMRFWLEGYYLVPFLAVIAFGPALRAALSDRRYVRALIAGAVVVTGLWVTVHAYSVADRRVRTPDVAGLDGTAFLAREFPCDAAIVEDLRRIPDAVRIGELCGTGEIVTGIPVDYGWAGRIAAFSGRPGICGWSRHVSQFTPRLRDESLTGPWTWDRFREYERHMLEAYSAALDGSAAPESRAFLNALDVTHVVVGDHEMRRFPGLSGRNLARALGGDVQFEGSGGCAVVSLAGTAGDAP
jgi:uncharacterized membrane protein